MLANDSILVTPGAGATVATHSISSKEHAAIVPCDSSGHILGSKDTHIFQSGFQTCAQNKIYFDLFNATGSGKVIRVPLITLQKNMAAQTGVALQWDLDFTSAVGTAGTSLTSSIVKLDSNNSALPAGITARHAPSGGATKSGTSICSRFYHSEETNVAAQAQEAFPFWPLTTVPVGLLMQDIVIRENQGLRLIQITSSVAGVYNTIVVFTVE